MTYDAVVIGAGPNGLVAANVLVDSGWSVLVLEAQPVPGGAVRSTDGPAPGFVTDLFSAFYPLAAASPAFAALELDRYGLTWSHAPAVLAHPLLDGGCALLTRDPIDTATRLEAAAAGDGVGWLELHDLWRRTRGGLLDAMTTPFPPVRAGVRLLRALRGDTMRFGRFAVSSARALAEHRFRAPDGPLLLAGSALHADLSPESPLSSAFGWLLAMLAHDVGFPVPMGGAGALTEALVRRLEHRGGHLQCHTEVVEVVVRDRRAVGVRTADGASIGAARAVIADVVAPHLYGRLVDRSTLPDRVMDDMRSFSWDMATFKVNWALRGPIPWSAAAASTAGTVHVGADLAELTLSTAQISAGLVPANPFLILGQMTTADPSRSPAGTESVWAYTHLPQHVRGDAGGEHIAGTWDERDAELMAARMERQIERFAPGFGDRIIARSVQTPRDLEAADANLVGGALNGGTAALHQQLIFRPVPGGGRPETPIKRLYLASSSAHPGGGVHGACGANAARVALRRSYWSDRNASSMAR